MIYWEISDDAVTLTDKTIQNIKLEYLSNDLPWSLAFSGGKDSSVLLKLVYLALEEIKLKSKPVNIIYCDTGVEIPVIRSFVIDTLNNLLVEAKANDIPIKIQIVTPALRERYFSKVIGKGYPPPSFKFRWCTDVLRIKPIKSFINSVAEHSIILLGIRKGESIERDRVLERHRTNHEYFFKQSNNKNAIIYSPIIKYEVDDVWSILNKTKRPLSINTKKLQLLYSVLNTDTSNSLGESDIFQAKGRFGCWTCTVVRHDRAMENLIKDGEEFLQPLLEFRNWLAVIRNNPSYRLKARRNGDKGLGPFTIEARKEILDRLLVAQSETKWALICDEEIEYIKNQWILDS